MSAGNLFKKVLTFIYKKNDYKTLILITSVFRLKFQFIIRISWAGQQGIQSYCDLCYFHWNKRR